MPTAELVRSAVPGCVGWRRAYVDWRATHGGQLDAIGYRVRELGLELLVHELFESAVKAGWDGAESSR